MLRITLKAAGLTDLEVQHVLPHIAGQADDFYDTPMYDKLYEYFAFTTGEMPYGTALSSKKHCRCDCAICKTLHS